MKEKWLNLFLFLFCFCAFLGFHELIEVTVAQGEEKAPLEIVEKSRLFFLEKTERKEYDEKTNKKDQEKKSFYPPFLGKINRETFTDANGNPLCQKEPYFKMVYYAFYMGEEAG